jgi:hypothetical protein
MGAAPSGRLLCFGKEQAPAGQGVGKRLGPRWGRTDKARPASSSVCCPAEFGRVMIDSVTLSGTMKALAPMTGGELSRFSSSDFFDPTHHASGAGLIGTILAQFHRTRSLKAPICVGSHSPE